jgi:hypothetical protein
MWCNVEKMAVTVSVYFVFERQFAVVFGQIATKKKFWVSVMK